MNKDYLKEWLKEWWQVIFFVAVIFLAATFIAWIIVGYHEIKVESTTDTITKYLPGEVIIDTIYYPVVYSEILHDTAIKYIYQDTSLLMDAIADYTTTRKYLLDYSTDTTGVFKVDLDIEQNKLQSAISTIQPLIKTQTITTTNTIYKNKPLSFIATAGASIDLTNYQLSGLCVFADRYVFGATTFIYQKQFGYTINVGIKF